MTDSIPSDSLVSSPLTKQQAKDKAIEAAETIANRCGGFWHWILFEKQIRVYHKDGSAFATIHVEPVQ